MKTHRITATADTAHQLNSLRAFNLDGNGLTRTMEFDSEKEAKDWLRQRAEMYNVQDPSGSEDKLTDMYESIEKHGWLSLDAVTAYIDEIEE